MGTRPSSSAMCVCVCACVCVFHVVHFAACSQKDASHVLLLLGVCFILRSHSLSRRSVFLSMFLCVLSIVCASFGPPEAARWSEPRAALSACVTVSWMISLPRARARQRREMRRNKEIPTSGRKMLLPCESRRGQGCKAPVHETASDACRYSGCWHEHSKDGEAVPRFSNRTGIRPYAFGAMVATSSRSVRLEDEGALLAAIATGNANGPR